MTDAVADAGVARFLAAAATLGAGELDVRVMDDSTHTAPEAAAAVGAPVEAIVKSLVLIAGDAPLLALVSGPNRVDTEVLAAALGMPVRMAKAREAKDASGYAIGGVPPFGHPVPIPTVLDETLTGHAVVWAAAGSARAVFPMAPSRLVEVTGARVLRVSG